ncbi:MAG: hypothetical protein WDW36_005850 [Sanguina aurantia]
MLRSASAEPPRDTITLAAAATCPLTTSPSSPSEAGPAGMQASSRMSSASRRMCWLPSERGDAAPSLDCAAPAATGAGVAAGPSRPPPLAVAPSAAAICACACALPSDNAPPAAAAAAAGPATSPAT